MKLNNTAKKNVNKYLKEFNKNGKIALSEEEINSIIAGMLEGDNQQIIAHNCAFFVEKTVELITEKMNKAIKGGMASEFKGVPEKVDQFVSTSIHDIVYSTYKCEERDVALKYMSDELDGTQFTEYANAILGKKDYKLSDAAVMDVRDKVSKGQSETEAMVQVTNTLSLLTKQVKEHYIDKTNKDYQATNEDFNEFLSKISVSYNAVHEMYNQKSFIGKWFTPSGWMLRNAMNSAKDCVKAYYNDLAKKNIRDEEEPDFNKNIIIPGVDGSSTEQISKYLKDYSDDSRIQITINDDGTLDMDSSETAFHNEFDKYMIPNSEEIAQDNQHSVDDDQSEVEDDDLEIQ